MITNLIKLYEVTNINSPILNFLLLHKLLKRLIMQKQLSFQINNKEISHKDLNVIRDFFTDEQWDLIDYALNEYQDHDDSTEKCKEVLDVISQLFRTSY